MKASQDSTWDDEAEQNRNRKKKKVAVKWEVATRQTDVFIFEVFLKFLWSFTYT